MCPLLLFTPFLRHFGVQHHQRIYKYIEYKNSTIIDKMVVYEKV